MKNISSFRSRELQSPFLERGRLARTWVGGRLVRLCSPFYLQKEKCFLDSHSMRAGRPRSQGLCSSLAFRFWTFIFLGVICLCGVGCGKNLQVRGKVTFSDDGSPLESGMILFQSADMVARGTIKEDGTFTMGAEKQTDGLPPGTYSVYFSNAIKVGGDPRSPGSIQMIPLLAPKYNSAATSEIAITIDRSTKLPLEIQVERP